MKIFISFISRTHPSKSFLVVKDALFHKWYVEVGIQNPGFPGESKRRNEFANGMCHGLRNDIIMQLNDPKK